MLVETEGALLLPPSLPWLNRIDEPVLLMSFDLLALFAGSFEREERNRWLGWAVALFALNTEDIYLI